MSVTGRDRPRTPHSGVSWGPRCLLSADESHGRPGAVQTPRGSQTLSPHNTQASRGHGASWGSQTVPTNHPDTRVLRRSRSAWPGALLPLGSSSFRPLVPFHLGLLCVPFSSLPPPSRGYTGGSTQPAASTHFAENGSKTVAKHSSKLMSCHLSEPRPGPLEWDFYTPNSVDGTQGTRGGALGPGTWQLSPPPAAGPRPPAPAVT